MKKTHQQNLNSDGTKNFRADLFPLDLERIEKEYMSFIHRIP